MPFVRNFWLWESGGIPPSIGYARFAEGRSTADGGNTGGVLYGREYDLTTFAVTLSSNFSKTPGNGNAESNGGGLGLFDLAQPTSPIANDLWNFTTRATIQTTNFQGAAVAGFTQACSNSQYAIIAFENNDGNSPNFGKITKQAEYNFGNQTFLTMTGPNLVVGSATSVRSQAIGDANNGYFFTGSITFSTRVWTLGDGPPVPPTPPVTAPASTCVSAWMLGGTVSDGDNVLTQTVPNNSATNFSSAHYKISTAVSVAGPNFSFTFPAFSGLNALGGLSFGGGASSYNGGISGATLGTFLEKGNTYYLTGSGTAQIEDYSYAGGTVTSRSGLQEGPNNVGSSTRLPGYYYGCPSVPGNF